jgi:transcriptional regulator with XRE-family HTH domain
MGPRQLSIHVTTTGTLVYEARRSCRITQQALADVLAISRAQVGAVENGYSSITGSRVLDWAEALGIKPRDLLVALREDWLCRPTKERT